MQAKPFYLSKTLLGAVVMAVSIGCQLYQIDVPQSDIDTAGADLSKALEGIAGLIGFVLVVIGRVKARSALKLSAKPE